MYAVIKTGGKQYRVKPGDLLVVEKLPGDPGAKVAFDQVLMIGEGEKVTIGAPTVAGAKVDATLVETRKGEKIKIFKKIRRQGYRRTRGHRQLESVLRVTAVANGKQSETWDGEVNLTPLAELTLRARNLARAGITAEAGQLTPPEVEVETVVEPAGKGKAPRGRARVVEAAEPVASGAETAPAEIAAEPSEVPAKKAKKPAAPKEPKTSHPTKAQAKASAPRPTKTTVRAPAVRKTSPRGKG